MTPADGSAQLLSPFAALAELAALVAAGHDPDQTISRALASLRRALAARECALRRPEAAGAAGDRDAPDSPPGGERAALAAPELATAVRHAGRELAVLSLWLGRPPTADERALARAAADVLAPVVARRAGECGEPDSGDSLAGRRARIVEKTIDSLPLGIYVIDRDYRIQMWNRRREAGTQGVAREEAVGRTIFEILHRQPAATLRGEFEEVFATGRTRQHEVDTLAGGELRSYRITKLPMRLEDGDVTHVITIGEDITEAKRAQERVARAERLAAVGQLAAGVMHEINNPLATIGVCADGVAMRLEPVALEPRVRAAIDDYLGIVRDEVERCRRIVGRLLDFSRPHPVAKRPLALEAVIGRTLQLLAHHPRFRQLTLEREPAADELPPVIGNEEALVQLFMALLLNAADAVPAGGRVTVRTRRGEAGTVVAEVADEGCGIPREHLARIFDPFFTTKEPGRGTGLGLSICYGIASDHAGLIEVDSTVGKGSTFRVILPHDSQSAA